MLFALVATLNVSSLESQSLSFHPLSAKNSPSLTLFNSRITDVVNIGPLWRNSVNERDDGVAAAHGSSRNRME